MNLNGTWYNELGSKMILETNGNNIVGTYNTGVGDASGTYKLVGLFNASDEPSLSIGWVVVWSNEAGNSESVTSWSGQLQPVDGQDTIVATWLLTSETDSDDDWQSTKVGIDRFTKTALSSDSIALNLKKGLKKSHPTKK